MPTSPCWEHCYDFIISIGINSHTYQVFFPINNNIFFKCLYSPCWIQSNTTSFSNYNICLSQKTNRAFSKGSNFNSVSTIIAKPSMLFLRSVIPQARLYRIFNYTEVLQEYLYMISI